MVIDPADYQYVTPIYVGKNEKAWDSIYEDCYIDDYHVASDVLKERGWDDGNGGVCDHCGTWFKWGVIYKNIKTDKYIVVGHICSKKTFDFDSKRDREVYQLKLRVERAKEAHRMRQIACEFIEANDLSEDIVVDHYIVKDIRSRLERWGKISEKQIALVRKLAAESRKPKEPELEYKPCEEGRIQISGKILCTKCQENTYSPYGGTVLKMLVLDNRMFKVWGTVPESICWDAEGNCLTGKLIGKDVCFIGTVTKSKDDECFGFFKRPSKAKLIG